MLSTLATYQLQGAKAARRHLEGVNRQLRISIVHQWLVENRKHPKAKFVDELLTNHRQFAPAGDFEAIEDAEVLIDRYTQE